MASPIKCVLATTLFYIFFSTMLCEAKGDLPDGILHLFSNKQQSLQLWCSLPRAKTIKKVITELLFADDCALLAHIEEALEHIIIHFSDAAKNFSLTISLKKTGAVPTPSTSTRSLQSSSDQHQWHQPQCSKQITYLGSIISNDPIVNKDFVKCLSKASKSFGRLSKEYGSHSLCLSTKIQVYRAITVPTVLYGARTWVLYWKQIRLLEQFHRCYSLRSILGIKWHDYLFNRGVLERTSLPSTESILLQVRLN